MVSIALARSMHRFGLRCEVTIGNGVGAALRLGRKPSASAPYGWIERLFPPWHKKSSHKRREGARRAAGRVAWSPAGHAAGLPDGRYFRMPAGLTIKDEVLAHRAGRRWVGGAGGGDFGD